MGRWRLLLVCIFLPVAFLVTLYGQLLLDGHDTGPEAEVAILMQGVTDVNTRTLALYRKEVTFFEPCPYQRQPASFEVRAQGEMADEENAGSALTARRRMGTGWGAINCSRALAMPRKTSFTQIKLCSFLCAW